MTLSTGGFRQVVAFPPAPIATGWSDPCREGLAPSQEPCLSTAHGFTITTPELKFSVHTGIAGGRQTIYTAALNWFVNRNVRFMFDYLHGNVARQVSPTNAADAGSRYDAFAVRTQVAF
jgi:hypothetical protein